MRKVYLFFSLVSCLLFNLANAQVSLSGSNYIQNFDGIASGLPSGWTVRNPATATTLGTAQALTTTQTNWNNTTGAFKNFASADGLTATSTTTEQGNSTDRALGLRQTGAFADPGGAFTLQIANTTGITNFQLSFKLQSLDQTSPRTATWLVQYGIGSNPSSFTTVSTIPPTLTTGGSAFSNVPVTVNFGTALDNQSENVWIRIVTLAATTGSGNRPSTAIDDFNLSFSSAPLNQVSINSISNANEGGSTGSFSVSVSPSAPGGTTIDYAITGLAILGDDYTATLTNGATPVSLTNASGTITIPADVSSFSITITPTNDVVNEGTENITITISNPVNPYSVGNASASINILDDDATATLIHEIQGTGTATAGTFTIEGIVTAVYPNWSPAGYYIQEETSDADADMNTSEGIFVVQTSPTVSVGDRVRITGTTQENSSTPSFNQAVIIPSSFSIVSTGNPLPAAVSLTLPVAAQTELEKYEGMIVNFAGELTVSNNDELGSRGSVTLAANGLIFQPTQLIDPNDDPASGTTSTGNSNVAAVIAYQNANLNRSIILDDGMAPIPATLPYVNSDNTLRVGSTVSNLTAVLGFGFSAYRLQPIPSSMPAFVHSARPVAPATGGNIKIASFNVLNYFNGDGAGGGFPTSRGANSLAEFNRQRNKIISALVQLNADVVGLIEIENDGTGSNSAIQDLVNGLNTVLGPNTYSFVNDGAASQTFNTDEIRCAIIYKSTVVSPIGSVYTSNNTVFERPPLAQTFRLISNSGKFNYIINHFKSKGGCPSSGIDDDQNDGQSCWNNRRKLQSQELVNFINNVVIVNSSVNRVVSMGDYNAYFEEDPMDVLRANGFNVLSTGSSYSYLFAGQVGSLDHAVVSPSVSSIVTGIAKWNTNSIEPVYLDYNDGVQDAGESASEVNPWASTYTPTPWRSSDHDAVVLGLDLPSEAATPVRWDFFTANGNGNKVDLKWGTLQESNTKEYLIERSNDGRDFNQIGRVKAAGNSSVALKYGFTDTRPVVGNNYYRLVQVDIDNRSEVSKTVRVFVGTAFHFEIKPNPAVGFVNISVTNGEARISAQIWDLQGRLIRQGDYQATNGPVRMDLAGVSKGVYMLKVISGNLTQTERLVVK